MKNIGEDITEDGQTTAGLLERLLAHAAQRPSHGLVVSEGSFLKK